MIKLVDTDTGRTIQVEPDEFADYLISLAFDEDSFCLDWTVIHDVLHLGCRSPYNDDRHMPPRYVHELVSWVFGEIPLRSPEDEVSCDSDCSVEDFDSFPPF
jgi:hypothetical protein